MTKPLRSSAVSSTCPDTHVGHFSKWSCPIRDRRKFETKRESKTEVGRTMENMALRKNQLVALVHGSPAHRAVAGRGRASEPDRAVRREGAQGAEQKHEAWVFWNSKVSFN